LLWKLNREPSPNVGVNKSSEGKEVLKSGMPKAIIQ